MGANAFPLRRFRTLREDRWWIPPLAGGAALAVFAAYFAWAAFRGGPGWYPPYLSPLFSPSTKLSPAWILWVPVGLRATCYYYRKVYSRAFLLAPPACAVADGFSGADEHAFLSGLQYAHRYFFYLSWPVLGFLWWDAAAAFRFDGGLGIGLGSLLLLGNAVLLTLFLLSCHSCRHVCGGYVKSLHGAPVRRYLWSLASRLSLRHGFWGWASLMSVAVADGYIRLLASGVIVDPRLL